MTPDIRGDDNPLLRHRLERLQRGHQLCQPHREARKDEKIRQIVIALNIGMGHPAGETTQYSRPSSAVELAKVCFLGSAAGEQHRDFRIAPPQLGDGAQQQMQPLVEIERPEKSDDRPAGQSQLLAEIRVGRPRPENALRSTAFGMIVTFSVGMPRAMTSRAQPFADHRNRIGALQCTKVSSTPGRMVAQIGLAIGFVLAPRSSQNARIS